MGSFSSGGLGGLIERGVAGRAGDVGAGIVSAREDTGFGGYNYGSSLTQEGLGNLRSLRGTFSDRLKDPLGPAGRNIFSIARGNLTDAFTRDVNSGAARRSQLALQSGGALTPEQIAAMDAQDRRDAEEAQFRGNADLSSSEAGMTLQETGKLFDRMQSIDQTITQVGQDEKNRGLQSILGSLALGLQRNKAISEEARQWVGMFMGKGGGGGAAAGGGLV